MVKLVYTEDLKSFAYKSVPVRVRLRAPRGGLSVCAAFGRQTTNRNTSPDKDGC